MLIKFILEMLYYKAGMPTRYSDQASYGSKKNYLSKNSRKGKTHIFSNVKDE